VRLLLDTHTFLWFIGGSEELSRAARGLIEDPNNQRLLSVASLWEMAIKVSLGKLKLDLSFVELAEREIRGNAIELLVIRPDHLDELAKLPFHHRDPFDRMIVAQGLAEDIPIISRDRAFESYSAKVLWQDNAKPR
jgi:PIN domain nuclease of toxin-antitoxin system